MEKLINLNPFLEGASDLRPGRIIIEYTMLDGLEFACKILGVILILALINMAISFIIGLRKKDCAAIFVTSILVKTIVIFTYLAIEDYFYIPYDARIFGYLIAFGLDVIFQGLIYLFVLKHQKLNPMLVSLICNLGTAIITTIIFNKFIEPKFNLYYTINDFFGK